MILKREDLRVAGRIVSTSTEGVVCDTSQVFSEDYVKKYNNVPQFRTNGFQSSINDKFLQLYSSLNNKVDSSVTSEAIPIEWLNDILI